MKHSIIQNTTEPHTPKINPAESQGGIIKRRVRNSMRTTNTPVRLWDYSWMNFDMFGVFPMIFSNAVTPLFWMCCVAVKDRIEDSYSHE